MTYVPPVGPGAVAAGNPEEPSPDPRAALQRLLDRTIDAQAGYDVLLDKAETDIAPLLQDFHDAHEKHAETVAAMISAYGAEPDSDGTLMSSVNRAVTTIRSMFDEIDEDVLDAVASGEEYVLETFTDAIEAVESGDAHDALVKFRAELAGLVAQARTRAD
ncbi:DUF2383 domain-containing protein [Rhodobacterales bacterium HKCCE3408]|nr:DUF2383 domain-containing protein [Rhodobacterales bacterium HKCCE3408]